MRATLVIKSRKLISWLFTYVALVLLVKAVISYANLPISLLALFKDSGSFADIFFVMLTWPVLAVGCWWQVQVLRFNTVMAMVLHIIGSLLVAALALACLWLSLTVETFSIFFTAEAVQTWLALLPLFVILQALITCSLQLIQIESSNLIGRLALVYNLLLIVACGLFLLFERADNQLYLIATGSYYLTLSVPIFALAVSYQGKAFQQLTGVKFVYCLLLAALAAGVNAILLHRISSVLFEPINELHSYLVILVFAVAISGIQALMLIGFNLSAAFAIKPTEQPDSKRLLTVEGGRRYLVLLLLALSAAFIAYRVFYVAAVVDKYRSEHSFTVGQNTSQVTVPSDAKPGRVYLNGQLVDSLAFALQTVQDHGTITLSKGYYHEAGRLNANFVKIIAEPGAVLYGKTVEGKGALVINGDQTYIEGLECHSIYVSDRNGVCVRLQGQGLRLNKVYFHHSQGGLLGSRNGGDIIVENSRFEHLGDRDFCHGIYTLAPSRLIIRNSVFLYNRNAGHEIKSRSIYTEITDSVVASGDSRDSRLIDVPDGGDVVIRNNLLIEGPLSENHDLLSWGVEGVKHLGQRVVIEKNIIVIDKPVARLLALKQVPKVLNIENNIVVGKLEDINESDNTLVNSRADFGLPDAPLVPEWTPMQ